MTRLRYPTIDDQGTQVADFTATPDETPILTCWAEPIEAQAEHEGRVAVLTGYKCTGPEGTVLDSFVDHVRFDGLEYELAGDAAAVRSPTGSLNEVIFTLRRWRHAS